MPEHEARNCFQWDFFILKFTHQGFSAEVCKVKYKLVKFWVILYSPS